MNKPKTTETGIKKLVLLLGLLIISPLIVSFGVKALRAFKDSPKILLAYGLLTLGILLILYTVYFGIKTFKTILDILFNN